MRGWSGYRLGMADIPAIRAAMLPFRATWTSADGASLRRPRPRRRGMAGSRRLCVRPGPLASTVGRGLKDLAAADALDLGRVRRPSGGSK